MKPKFETVELLSPTGEVVELKVVKRGLAQARPEPVDRNKPAWIKAPFFFLQAEDGIRDAH